MLILLTYSNKSRQYFAEYGRNDYFCALLTSIIRMNNKRYLLIFAALILVLINVGSKGNQAKSVKKLGDSVASLSKVSDPIVAEKEVPLVVDSIKKEYHTKTADLLFVYSFPTSGPRPLIDSLRVYLSSEMHQSTVIYEDEDILVKPYKQLADGNGMIKYYAKAAFKNLSRILEDSKDEEVAWKPDLSMFVLLDNETNRYVTYVSTYGSYLGGAHGIVYEYGVNFDKKTGKKLKNVLKPHSEKKLQTILRKGIESYFRDMDGFEENDKESREAYVKEQMGFLFVENGIIPLPNNGVYLTPEGVVFIYGFYEVGAYVIGMPTFVVPYHKIKNFLTPEALRLAELDK